MPWSLKGARTASIHLVNILGARARQNGRTLYWYAFPPKANLCIPKKHMAADITDLKSDSISKGDKYL